MKRISWFFSTLLLSANVWAIDGVSLEVGNGDYTDTARVGLVWNWDKPWYTGDTWQVTGFWEAAVGRWQGHSSVGNNQTITDIAITPVLRLQQIHPSSFSPYLEGAVGFHLISPTFIYANRHFGSSFQFGDHVGFGVQFGEQQQFDLGYRYQHLSNASIKQPNQGINLNQIHFIYHF